MRIICLLLVCFILVASARQESRVKPLQDLAKLLLAQSPVPVSNRAVASRQNLASFGFRLFSMSSKKTIEVERKFEPEDPDTFRQRVLANGGSIIGEKLFTDTYYDSLSCVLTRRDTWLRKRGEDWELKLPLGDPADRRGASGGERTVFREIEGADAVAVALAPLLPVKIDGSLKSLLEENSLQPFAEFHTVRTRYKLGPCSIDADVASFGHAVLEIEVMAESEEDVPQAELEIARVADLLGCKPLGGTGGKLETYIRTKAPEVFAQLVDAGILRP